MDPTWRDRQVEDCARFQAEAGDRIGDSVFDREHAGRDFWYTRNGHGCGFWDGDWPNPIGEELAELTRKYGYAYLEMDHEYER